MNEGERVPIAFSPREEPLAPAAVVAIGLVAHALGEHLLQRSDEQLLAWTGVAGENVLIVLGAAESLPWVDGVSYLGRDPRAPRLLLPTNLQPDATLIELFEAAVIRRASELTPPLAVLVSPPRILSLAAALPIRRARLLAWLESTP